MLSSLFVLIGTFIGAGFASGKEIFNFFSIFNIYSFLGILVFSILTFLIVYKTLQFKTMYNIHTYADLLNFFEKKFKYFNSKVFLKLVNFFLLISFYIMICAICTLFYDKFYFNKFITVFITITICYNVFSKNNLNFIYKLNLILMPILILFFIILGIKTTVNTNIIFDYSSFSFLFLIKSLLYFSYNNLLIVPILFQLHINSKKILRFSLLFSFIIFILMNLLNLILLVNFNEIYNKELPVLHISASNGFIYSFLYFVIFLSAVITTMMSSGFAFCNNITTNKKNKILFFLLASLIFSIVSFSNLINLFYTILGVVGFIQISLILLNYKS